MTLEQAEEAMNSIHMPGATSASAPPTASPQGNLALPSPPPAAPPGGLPGPPAPQGEFAPPAGPTPFLQVEGMVTADVLMGDAEYAEVRHFGYIELAGEDLCLHLDIHKSILAEEIKSGSNEDQLC